MKKFVLIFLSAFVVFSIALDLPKVEMNPLQKEIIQTALSMVGGKYGWGAYDPENKTFDCWNFVTWVFHHVLDKDGGVKHMLIGIDDPLWVFFDDPKVLRPGDVLMNGGEHTVGFHAGIYYGKGYTIEARGGRYGIGVFRIEGRNGRCPFGETGYRFCYYSLLARLWLDPHPDFPYVYAKLHQSFYFSDEGVKVELHAYSPKKERVEVVIEIVDYLSGKVVTRKTLKNLELGGREKVEEVTVKVSDYTGYVYVRVRMLKGSEPLFEYDTYIRGHVEII